MYIIIIIMRRQAVTLSSVCATGGDYNNSGMDIFYLSKRWEGLILNGEFVSAFPLSKLHKNADVMLAFEFKKKKKKKKDILSFVW